MKKMRVLLYFIIIGIFFLVNFYFRPITGNPLVTKEYKDSAQYVNDIYYSDEMFKKHLLDEDAYYIYDAIIDNSLKNISNVKIPCNSDSCSSDFSNAITAIWLDHPELISFRKVGSYRYNGNFLTYTNYENLDKVRTFLGSRRIAREMENIRRDTKNMSDKEKIIYVYNYVASHDYDYLFMYNGSNQSIYSFFTKGTSVCAGFAKASQIIFQNIGIKSYLVQGSEHMWNYVEYEGKYYVFDATMGTAYYKDTQSFYSGLGSTTVGVIYGENPELYPPIEEEKLRVLFGI